MRYVFELSIFLETKPQKSMFIMLAGKLPAPTNFATVHLTILTNRGGTGSSGDLFLSGLVK